MVLQFGNLVVVGFAVRCREGVVWALAALLRAVAGCFDDWWGVTVVWRVVSKGSFRCLLAFVEVLVVS
jgi:hypothetical protein